MKFLIGLSLVLVIALATSLVTGVFVWLISGLVTMAFDAPRLSFLQSWTIGIVITFIGQLVRGAA